LKPVYTFGNLTKVKANSISKMVFVLEKVTIPDAKHLLLQINETNGGRHFMMRIKNKHLMEAITLPDYK
jgi:hypothetical protein